MDKIASALVKAQKAFGPALKTHTNPAFKSRYADLGACIEAVIDALNSTGIALIQKQHPCEGGVTVETLFVHESGEMLSAGLLSVPAAKQDPQGYGSALTYCRRYSLMAACGIAPEDDDGNAAGKARNRINLHDPARLAWIAARVADINSAKTKAELKEIMDAAIAHTSSLGDADAEDLLHAACESKIAAAKAKQASGAAA